MAEAILQSLCNLLNVDKIDPLNIERIFKMIYLIRNNEGAIKIIIEKIHIVERNDDTYFEYRLNRVPIDFSSIYRRFTTAINSYSSSYYIAFLNDDGSYSIIELYNIISSNKEDRQVVYKRDDRYSRIIESSDNLVTKFLYERLIN